MNELSHVLYVLLGAALVWGGTLASALADRIREGKRARTLRECNPRTIKRMPNKPQATSAHEQMERDVIGALITAGYSAGESVTAATSCAGSETSTLESWTRAALKRCLRKEARS